MTGLDSSAVTLAQFEFAAASEAAVPTLTLKLKPTSDGITPPMAADLVSSSTPPSAICTTLALRQAATTSARHPIGPNSSA
jgi:hypothetical protein